jgi:hypothetical protein
MHRRIVHLVVTLLILEGSLLPSPLVKKPASIAVMPTIRLPEEMPAQTKADEQRGARVPINLHANQPEILTMLKDLVARFGKAKRNTFYVSPIARKAEGEYAYIYWKQDNSIITLDLPLKAPLEEEAAFWLYTGKARIDLVKGVVPTEDKIGSSTFLVARPWVDWIIKDCVSNGRKITIPRLRVKRNKRFKA